MLNSLNYYELNSRDIATVRNACTFENAMNNLTDVLCEKILSVCPVGES